MNASGRETINQARYVLRSAPSGVVFLDTSPPSNPPMIFAIPIAVKIQAVRCGTSSIVAKAGTATSNTPQPNPIKQPSTTSSCSGLWRHIETFTSGFASGIQLRAIFVIASEPPPIAINADATMSALPGCDERARDVTRTGPITPAALITAVSTAYAVRSHSSVTASRQSGRTDKLIGGAVSPRMSAKIKRRALSDAALRVRSISA